MFREVRFAFQHHGCWMQEATQFYPDVALFVSGMYVSKGSVHVQIVVRADRPELVAHLEGMWRRDTRIRSISTVSVGPWGARFQAEYALARSTVPVILQHTPVSVGTVRVADGTEYYTVAGEAEEIEGLLAELGRRGRLRVLSAHPIPRAASDWEFGPELQWATSLTRRQREALLLAFREGYYEWPRRRTVSAIAHKHGLATSTLLDNLRMAESAMNRQLVAELDAAVGAGKPSRRVDRPARRAKRRPKGSGSGQI